MYTVYLDGNLLYAPNLAKEGFVILSGKLTTALNKAGSFTFTIPPSNPCYNSIHLMKSVVTIMDEQTEIFRGRVLKAPRDFNNHKEVYCEGWLACLLDSLVRPYNSRGSVEARLRVYIAQHNQMVEPEKQFVVRTVTVTDPNDYIVRASADYPRTWDEIQAKLIKLLGGYIRYERARGQGAQADNRFNYIDYIADYNSISNQTIEFGRNLLSFEEYITAENVYTAIIPLGAKDEETEQRLDITSVNDGLDYLVNQQAAAIFGTIWHTETWNDVTIASNLKTKAQAELDKNVSASVSLKMNAFDLHILDVNTDSFQVGDRVRVISLPHGVDDYFLCSEIQRDLLYPENSIFTFGMQTTTLTGNTYNQTKGIQNTLNAVINVPPPADSNE